MCEGYVLYSIYRQRRLIALCAALPGVMGLLAFSPMVGLWIAISMGLVAALVLGTWPVSHIDTLGLSISTTLILPVAAFIGTLSDFAVAGKSEMATAWLCFILLVSWFFLWLGVTRALCALDGVHAGQQVREGRCYLDVPVAEAAEIFCLAPEQDRKLRQTGPADQDGVFEVSFEVDGVDPVDFTETRVRHAYLARVIEQEVSDARIRNVQQTILRDYTPARSSVIEQVFEADGQGTSYWFREVHDLFSVLSVALFWLQDAEADQVQAELDAHYDRPVQSCTYGSQTTLLSVIARWFVENGYAPRNDPDA